jgi:predicted patatin/cPLA2 family phospholipase
MEKEKNSCIIVEGGGFKTGFTSGILDGLIMSKHDPFTHYIGISGGAVALSYFLSKQYRYCISAMKILSKDQAFMNYRRTFGKQGYMDIDFLSKVAMEKVPFDIKKAIAENENCKVHFVATNRLTGEPAYLCPTEENWLDIVIASCTLPFVTKGKHLINDNEYFDGGWSDPLPVKWAYEQGNKNILVVRTWPKDQRSSQSWSDYFGSIYFNSTPQLSNAFANCYKRYNEGLDFIKNPPSDLTIKEINPHKLLKSGTYSYSNKTIMSDYRYGLDKALMYVNELGNS